MVQAGMGNIILMKALIRSEPRAPAKPSDGGKIRKPPGSLKNDPKLVARISFDNGVLAKSRVPYKITNHGADFSVDRFNNPKKALLIEKRFFSFEYINLDNNIFSGLEDFTIAFWAKIKELNTSGKDPFNTFLSVSNNITDNQILFNYKHEKNALRLHIWDSNSHWNLWGGVIIEPKVWNHYAITRQGNLGKIFFNGNQITSGSISDKPIQSEGAIIGQDQDSVGGSFQNNQVLNGSIDDLFIFSRSLSGDEIKKMSSEKQ